MLVFINIACSSVTYILMYCTDGYGTAKIYMGTASKRLAVTRYLSHPFATLLTPYTLASLDKAVLASNHAGTP